MWGGGESRAWDVVGVIVHGLLSGSGVWDGSGDGVRVVSRVSDSPNRDSFEESSSSSPGAGLAFDRWARVEPCLARIFFNAFCVRLFLLLSKSFAIFAPSCLRFALIA